jgi:hypothetical protein
MPLQNGMNCIKVYNLYPFSKSFWQNIGIFERNSVKGKNWERQI